MEDSMKAEATGARYGMTAADKFAAAKQLHEISKRFSPDELRRVGYKAPESVKSDGARSKIIGMGGSSLYEKYW